MRCHQLEQELRLAFDRKVQQDRQYDNEKVLIDKRHASLERQIEYEKECLETCRRQLRAHDSLCASLGTLMAESRKICEDSLGCVDELTHVLLTKPRTHATIASLQDRLRYPIEYSGTRRARGGKALTA